MSKSGAVLEDIQSGPRRSLRVNSQTGMKAFEIPQQLPHSRRYSKRLLGVAPACAENVKKRIKNSVTGNEAKLKEPQQVDHKVVVSKSLMELASVPARAENGSNELNAIAKPNPKIPLIKDCRLRSSQIRRAFPNIKAVPNGVVQRGNTMEIADKRKVAAERLHSVREDMVSETGTEKGISMSKTADVHYGKCQRWNKMIE